ncbi:D-amino acid dehydrogenase small subunit [Anatilimnocola aggregata]|uniref:D-amino acid dehydrogenase small subunit n=1 Tax=Anatilimnocola aggregata TaxID=2528021 RepID=A0A517YCE3_9BACT|nr:TIGR03364 family FAD-dependent oxidoreductase [Anatilimnocola aggregata]QDU27913.1 D-amino acid dehydrogenase small subunit [Anatilimnocola aggregata]
MKPQQVGIIGAGIVGLAYAWSAAQRGHRVTVFERSPQACGASIRNFGMIWPIGQPAGEPHEIALASAARWRQVGEAAGIWVNPCGSVHLAHRDDEWQVLQEFHAQSNSLGFECELLTCDEVLRRTPGANREQLKGGLFSPTELGVNPRAAIRELPGWLAKQFGVQFEFQTVVTAVDDRGIRTANGRTWSVDRAVVCAGADFASLFPEVLATAGMKQCKLQMLRTVSQSSNWRIGPHLASGLTLRHYHNFDVCPSLEPLKARIAHETPELDRYGIHVMASQNNLGEVILGDSHEYDDEIELFDKTLIDDLMLRELQKILHLPNWSIAERWHGVYAKHSEVPLFAADPQPNVHIRTGTGGAGMTMSFGLAERCWNRWSAVAT